MNNSLRYAICLILLSCGCFTSAGKEFSFRGSNNTAIGKKIEINSSILVSHGVDGESSMDELWKAYKKNRKDFKIQQRILQELPGFSMKLTNRGELEKWQVRAEKLFKEYWEGKSHDEMFNIIDLNIIMLYAQKPEKNNGSVEFLIQNFEKCCSVVSPQTMLTYLAAYMNMLINQLAMAGDAAYKKELARLQGDLKPIFNLVKTKSLPVEYLMTAKADALYALYGQKDQSEYVKLQQDFLEKMDTLAGLNEYKDAALNLMLVVKDKLTLESARQSLVWLDKAITFDVTVHERGVLVVAMGDCYFALKNMEKAKECYNQAYLLSLQLSNLQLQNYIRQKLATVAE